MDVLDKLASRIAFDGDCWLWPGSPMPNGYGRIRVHGQDALAHRAAWQALVGPIPDGLELDHLCKVRNCVNPDHLEPVTRAVNISRSERTNSQTCRNGHPWIDWITEESGRRRCRQCRNATVRRYRSGL